MAQPYVFPGKRVLADITVTQLAPGATHTTTITGTKQDAAGTSQITTIGGVPVLSTTALSGLFGDATDLIVEAPEDANGIFPDVEIRPFVDGQDWGDRINLDGSAIGNMMPNPAKTVGEKHIALGIALREGIQARMKNLPLKTTGLKAMRQYQFRIFSNLGWGNNGAVRNALRLILLGDKLDNAALAQTAAALQQAIAQGYDPFSFTDQVPGFPAFTGALTLPGGALTSSTWTAWAGGNDQKGTAIYRFLRQAYNFVATAANGIWILSNKNSVGGADGSVASDVNDLGFDQDTDPNYYHLGEFGVRAGQNQAFVGVKVDDTILPDQPNGLVVTEGVNPWNYGLTQPQRSDATYTTLKKSPFPVAAYRNKVAFFVVANGTAIPAQLNGTTQQDAASVAVGGLLIKPAA